MPRKTRTRRRPSTDFSRWHLLQLSTGFSFKGIFGPDFGYREAFDHSAAVEAWAILREEILREHLAQHPCTRPWAWWTLERERELRRRVDGKPHPCDPKRDRRIPPRYGLPSRLSRRDDFDALYESVPAYLARLGLLTGPERAYLERHPDLLAPVYADNRGGWERT